MKTHFSIFALVIALVGVVMYWTTSPSLSQTLLNSEWQARLIVYVDLSAKTTDYLPADRLDRVEIEATARYLPNNTYIRNSKLLVSKRGNDTLDPVEVKLAETGTWELNNGYLIVKPQEYQNVSTKVLKNPELEQPIVDAVIKLFKINSQQSRRIDIINEHLLLMTSLGNNSYLMYDL